MKIIEKSKEKIVFSSEMDESLANAIRRSVSEIPILAIDEVEFFKNDSALYDEIIAHRLGLVPLEYDDSLVEIEKCSCKGKGCNKCTIQLKISMKGPTNVYSGDLKGRIKAVYEKMPIVLLTEDQELELVAYVRLGKGINHAKYNPGLAYYRNLAEIEVSSACNGCKKCIEACPHGLIKVEKKAAINDKEFYKCDLCDACVEACKKEGKNAIKINPTKEIIFFIESWGQIEAKEILIGAIEALKDNLDVLKK